MATRTTDGVLRSLLEEGGCKVRADANLLRFILPASKLTTRVADCAADKGEPLDAEELELMERWLAAWMYTMANPRSQSTSLGKASHSIQGQTGMRLEANYFGQVASSLDPSGCLQAITSGKTVQFFWAGKPPSEQIPYDQRD